MCQSDRSIVRLVITNHTLSTRSFKMTPIETTKTMLASLNLSDEELKEVRDVCDMLAVIVVDDWIEKRITKNHD